MKAASILGCLTAVVLPLLAVPQSGDSTVRDPLVVVKDGKYGYTDHKGAMLIPPQFWWGADFDHGFGAVYICGRVVSIDARGNLGPLRAAQEHELRPKLVGGKSGVVDDSGQFKKAAAFDYVLPFSDDIAPVRLAEHCGCVDAFCHVAITIAVDAATY